MILNSLKTLVIHFIFYNLSMHKFCVVNVFHQVVIGKLIFTNVFYIFVGINFKNRVLTIFTVPVAFFATKHKTDILFSFFCIRKTTHNEKKP